MTTGESSVSQPTVVLKGGASFVSCKPVFSNDSKFLLVGSGFNIKVLSVKSGECVRELKGHQAKVTSIALHPNNTYQVYSCSKDQTIIKWDYTDGAILKQYKCPNRLHLLKPTNLKSPEFVGIAQITKSECALVQFSLPIRDREVELETLENRLTTDANTVSFGCKESIIACVYQRLVVVRSIGTQNRKVHKLNVDNRHADHHPEFTVVSCHPLELCVATGASNGAISLWYNFMSKKKVVVNDLHWHALPVRTLSFTTEGSYLLSGGHECVLVKWQHNTHHRDTLPRLGSPLIHISTSRDNLYYATSHSDNSIQVVTAQFRVTQAFVGLTRAHLDEAGPGDDGLVGLLLDPRSGSLVLNGRPGQLQFYNLRADRQLYSLDIVCQNYISPENLMRPLVMTEVIAADFSADGDWLATVDWRDDNETAVELRLTFWMYDTKAQTYTLNTSVQMPHADHVHTIKFRPPPPEGSGAEDQAPAVVTSSGDCCFKLWAVTDDSDIYRSRSCWRCESVGFYRDLAPGPLDFSEDGSLLAVAFDSQLTLWDPDTNALRHTFPLQNKIWDVVFGCGTSSHLVVVATRTKVSALNLLTCSLAWSLPLHAAVMCRHAPTGHLAIFTASRTLVVLDMISPDVVYEHPNISPVDVKAATFVPSAHASHHDSRLPWHDEAQLYFLNYDQELLSLTEQAEAGGRQLKVTDRLPETPFSLLLSEERRRKRHAAEPAHHAGLPGRPVAQYLTEMLNTPAHVLPPVSSLCASFMSRLLVSKKPSGILDTEDTKDDDDASNPSEDSDSDMEVDEAPPVVVQPPGETTANHAENIDFSHVTADMLTWIAYL